MSISVTARVNSGRRNPKWELKPDVVQDLLSGYHQCNGCRPDSSKEVTEGLQRLRRGGLGYRGFIIESTGDAVGADKLPPRVAVYGGIVDISDHESRIDESQKLEDDLWKLYRKREPKVSEKRPDTIYEPPQCSHVQIKTQKVVYEDRPPYKPEKWNRLAVIALNNCYNYANNRFARSGDGAEPGAGGRMVLASGTCADLRVALEADGLSELGKSDLFKSLPGDGWPIALFVKKDSSDFHFYRQDATGRWSHKPGGFEARDCDDRGEPIRDPTEAPPEGYQFCGYYLTNRKAHIK